MSWPSWNRCRLKNTGGAKSDARSLSGLTAYCHNLRRCRTHVKKGACAPCGLDSQRPLITCSR